MKTLVPAILLILFLTPMLCANESMILEPPPEIAGDETLMMLVPEGTYTIQVPAEGILVFSPAGWKALSEWVYQEHLRSCESAIAEALKGSMQEINKYKRQRNILLGSTAVAVTITILGGIVVLIR